MRILIFGTLYCDTDEKARLARLWETLHSRCNTNCDLLLVDSDSPVKWTKLHANVLQLGDNIGHLARGGRDGWGRAFCAGLEYAMREKYDWVVHIEGDSLCKVNIESACRISDKRNIDAVSVPVRGTKRIEKDWVETGLMLLRVPFVRRHRVVEMYDWQDGASKKYPHTPEWVMHYLLGHHLHMASWRNMRDDNKILTSQSVRDYDWVSHATPEVYDAFMELEHA